MRWRANDIVEVHSIESRWYDLGAYVHWYNPLTCAQCAVVLDTTAHVGARDGKTTAHEMCTCLTDSHALMHGCFLDICTLVCSCENNRHTHVHIGLGESYALEARLRGVKVLNFLHFFVDGEDDQVFLCRCNWSVESDSMMWVHSRDSDWDCLWDAVRAQPGVQRYLAACE